MEKKNQRRLIISLAVLLATLIVVVVKNHDFWFGSDDSAAIEETSPSPASNDASPASTAPPASSASNTVAPAKDAGNAGKNGRSEKIDENSKTDSSAQNNTQNAKNDKNDKSAKNNQTLINKQKANNNQTSKNNQISKNNQSAKDLQSGASATAIARAAEPTVIPGTRVELPPMEVEVVAGDAHRKMHAGSNTVLVEMPTKSAARAAEASSFKWSPATPAAEKTQLASNIPMAAPESITKSYSSSYPSLDRQMKVQGSVLLQALVAADGVIRDLHVLSGNPILTSAAMEAVRQWRFKPVLQNGQPVETQAKIMVNFGIKIL